jgi:hypothetical protein
MEGTEIGISEESGHAREMCTAGRPHHGAFLALGGVASWALSSVAFFGFWAQTILNREVSALWLFVSTLMLFLFGDALFIWATGIGLPLGKSRMALQMFLSGLACWAFSVPFAVGTGACLSAGTLMYPGGPALYCGLAVLPFLLGLALFVSSLIFAAASLVQRFMISIK